jgi:adenylate cyclase
VGLGDIGETFDMNKQATRRPLSELIAEWEKDPEMAAHLENARKWLKELLGAKDKQ